jgi:hypothetical protein
MILVGIMIKPESDGKVMTREEAICIAEEFSEWIEDMVEKYSCDNDDLYALVKQFLLCEANE